MLTWLVDVIPPRLGHLIARALGIPDAYTLFCRCCPAGDR